MTFVILGLLAYLSFYFARLAYGDIFAPVGLFFGINLASLSLYRLNLIFLLVYVLLFGFLSRKLSFSLKRCGLICAKTRNKVGRFTQWGLI
jgi:hypothetical protein